MARPRPGTAYRLKITLVGIEPPVWRWVEVEDCTLLRLHKVIQASMGWEGRHA
jgi:Plasmid pRiA4b ORF-3-like protein